VQRPCKKKKGEVLQEGSPYDAYPYFGFHDVDVFACPPFVMFTANDSPISGYLLSVGCFERMSTKIWAKLAQKATGIFDIGANVGVYSMIAASIRRDIPVHAFEPNPYAYARLRLHKNANGFSNIVEHRYALADQSGTTMLSWVTRPGLPISSGAALVEGNGQRESVLAELQKFDDLAAASQVGDCGLIKIDVEGAEAAVFQGMKNVLVRKPDIILETFSQFPCNVINAMIRPLGYRVYHVLEREEALMPRDDLMPCDTQSGSLNHLLTVRPEEELLALLA